MKASPQLTIYSIVSVVALSLVNCVRSFCLGSENLRKSSCICSTVPVPFQDARSSLAIGSTVHSIEEAGQEFVKTIEGPFNAHKFASTRRWGNKPLLIRSAFDTTQLISNNDEDPIWPTWDAILEIATDEDAGARLIQHVPDDLESFTLDLGPFSESELQSLSNPHIGETDDRKWTLVVNDVERFHPPLSDWMDETFSFLPQWRRDDGQVSLAHTGGGIGPHVDNYDVFLIQTSGTREWEIISELVSIEKEMEELVDGIDVRVFRHWDIERENGRIIRLELGPGDLLYLPPRVAHCGTALSDSCMTLSVGCRAPSASELVSRIAERISEAFIGCAVKRYEDPDLLDPLVDEEPPIVPKGEITGKEKTHMKKLVKDAVNEIMEDECKWDELVGKIVTESKRPRENYPVPLLFPDGSPYDEDWNESLGVWGDPNLAIQAVFEGKGALYHAEGVAFSFSSVSALQKTYHRLFVNGEMFEIVTDPENQVVPRFVRVISNDGQLTKESLLPLLEEDQTKAEMIRLLQVLVSKGVLYGSNE